MIIIQASIPINVDELWAIAPEMIVTLFACFALVIDIIAPQQRGKWTAYFCLGGLGLAAGLSALPPAQNHGSAQISFYFLLGAFSSGILLYGISLIYGATGSTNLSDIAAALPSLIMPGQDVRYLVMMAMVLIAAGMFFKIAAVPFHMWAPDAYEGAPTPVTAFLSTGSKAAAFVVLARIFSMGFLPLGQRWATLLAILAVASMTPGNVAAILPEEIQRMP